ncbi:protein-L-isoaspartate O-methyltransferase family protein [Pseudoroseicyclus aestuarii]
MMVDTQVRPSDVTSFPIIDAMLNVPRERFVPAGLRDAAYAEEDLPLAPGRAILAPRTFAKMLGELELRPDSAVLEIASGLGYGSAVLARLAGFVAAVEDDADLAAQSQETLSELGIDNVAVMTGPLAQGAAESGPYDAIIIEGAIERFPEGLDAQLRDGGRVAAIFIEGALGIVRIGYKHHGSISWRYAFNAGAPALPGFDAAKAFTL